MSVHILASCDKPEISCIGLTVQCLHLSRMATVDQKTLECTFIRDSHSGLDIKEQFCDA